MNVGKWCESRMFEVSWRQVAVIGIAAVVLVLVVAMIMGQYLRLEGKYWEIKIETSPAPVAVQKPDSVSSPDSLDSGTH